MADVPHMPRLRAIVDAYTAAHGSSDSWVSEKMGMTRQTLNGWWNNGLSTMPSPHQLYRLAMVTHTPYRDVLDAALQDFSYLPESAAEMSEPTPRMKRRAKPNNPTSYEAKTAPLQVVGEEDQSKDAPPFGA